MTSNAELAAYAASDPAMFRVEAERELSARGLSNFIRRAWHVLEPNRPYVHGWHIDCISEHLEAVHSGEIKRLLINEPPGMMKSLQTGVFFPAWEWGPKERPDIQYLTAAHEQDLAIRDTVKMRRLIQSDWFQQRWPIKFVGDQNQKKRFENIERGFRASKAITNMTGDRGDRVIIDDPHSVSQAESETQRKAVVQNFREAINSRVNDPQASAIIVIMQRLHEKDVSGTILELGGWEHLMLPMRYEPERACHTVLGLVDRRTEAGELLCPERFPEKELAEAENTLGAYGTAGQHQQNPTPRTGGLFEKDKFILVDRAPACVRWVAAWDFAASLPEAGKKPDWSVRLKMGMTRQKQFVIAHVNRFQKDGAGVNDELVSTAKLDGRRVRISLPQDPGAAGKAQAQFMVGLLAGYKVIASPETGSKIQRADLLASQVAAGNVMIVDGEWTQAFLDEVGMFPNAAHDDQVDAASRAFVELVNGKWVAPAPKVTASM